MSLTKPLLSTEFDFIAERAVDEEINNKPTSNLKKYYLQCFDQAEIEGIPRHLISKTVRSRLNEIKTKKILQKDPEASESECLINDSWYFECAREAGVTDPSMARNTNFDPDPDQENSSIYTGINAEIINRVRNIKKSCNVVEHSFKNLTDKNNKPVKIEDLFTKKELDALYHDLDNITNIINTSVDQKTIVPKNTHALFKDCFRIEAGLLNTAKIFLQTRIRMIEGLRLSFITKKQASKFKRGAEPNPLTGYYPKYREEAIFMGWYGLQCEQCESWRVDEHAGTGTEKNLKCIDCGNLFEGKTVTSCRHCGLLFYREELLDIIETGKCPNESCQKPVQTLPPHLVSWAKKSTCIWRGD